MEKIFEDVSDYIVVINESKIIKFCNKKFAEKLKYKAEEVIDMNLEDVDLEIDYIYCGSGKNQRVTV